MKIFLLPDLGEGLPDAEIHQWYIKEGDTIKADDLMVSMETAKAVVDVPAPRSGKVIKLYGKPGDVITIGSPLVEFEDGEDIVPKRADAGTVAGRVEVGNTILEESATGVAPIKSSGANIKAMPAIRALAKKLNVDLSTIQGSGPNGQITTQDVERAEQNTSQASGYESLRGVRRAMASAMVQSHVEVVPVTLMDDADLHFWEDGSDVTLRVLRAIIAGCRAEPALNAWFDSKSIARKRHEEIHIGIAMDSTEGLFVPVLKNADKTEPAQLRQQIDNYKTQVKDRSIPQENLRGATIVVSNFGMFAARYANPIIVPPTVAILGIGRIRDEVVAYESKPEIHKILPLSLTIDHRAVTGGEATRFLSAVIKDLESRK